MAYKKIIIVTSLSIFSNADTLPQIVKDVLNNNPIVQERLHNYRATRLDIKSAKAGYRPTLDLEMGIGKSYKGRFSKDANKKYDIFENTLRLRQDLFNGFSTQERVNYQKMRTLASAYSYLEKANDVTLQTIRAYINILRYRDMLINARYYLRKIKKLKVKVKKSYKAGLTRASEVSRIESTISSAKNNLLASQNRLENAIYTFRRITGRKISLRSIKPIHFKAPLPRDKEKAILFALEYNPSLIVEKYNIKGAEALYRESKSKFYPKVYAEVTATYNDNFKSNVTYPDKVDNIKAMIRLHYNIFNGGADEADRLKRLTKISQEITVRQNLRRQVIEGLELSWSNYLLTKRQIPLLKRYKTQTQKSLKLYEKEFSLGTRSLLDLLSVEGDLKRAKDELITVRYDQVLAKYRILDAMGLTMASVLGNVKHIYKRVGLFNRGKSKRDHLPVKYDVDRDGVADIQDICVDSKYSKNGVRPSGCRNVSYRKRGRR